MANVTHHQLEGIAELKATLEALGTETATKIGVKANRDAAKLLQSTLIETAPVGARSTPQNKRYGRLRDNIKISRRKAQKQGHIVHFVTIGRAFWGFFQEFGTRFMAARPWMRPAVETQHKQLIDAQAKGLREGIERATKRLARIKRKG